MRCANESRIEQVSIGPRWIDSPHAVAQAAVPVTMPTPNVLKTALRRFVGTTTGSPSVSEEVTEILHFRRTLRPPSRFTRPSDRFSNSVPRSPLMKARDARPFSSVLIQHSPELRRKEVEQRKP